MKRIFSILFLTLLSSVATAQVPDDAAVRKILADRIDAQKQSLGIVVGIVDSKGRRVVAHGRYSADDERSVDGDSVFEIGSVTKVFTSLLLADMVERGEVKLTDPISKFLPPDVKVPKRAGKVITLETLANHTSGLARLPTNMAPADLTNPYADYTVVQLYEFLSSYELPRDIGSKYEYSNLGAGLLGHVLALRAGTDYETLVRTRILEPLEMNNTSITLTDSIKSRLVPGHDAALTRTTNWDLPTLAGAGALRSTVNDMLKFVSAQMGLTKSPLAPAMKKTTLTRRPTDNKGLEIAFGWHVATGGGREIVWHNGGTGGYRSFVGFDSKTQTGVVVLSNTSTAAGIDDIGRHVLDSRLPLLEPMKERTAVAVDPQRLDRYVGRYELAPNFVLTVTREGAQLFVQATGQPRFELFGESEGEFFAKVVDAQITFVTGESGPATGLVLHQGGRDMPAKRIE